MVRECSVGVDDDRTSASNTTSHRSPVTHTLQPRTRHKPPLQRLQNSDKINSLDSYLSHLLSRTFEGLRLTPPVGQLGPLAQTGIQIVAAVGVEAMRKTRQPQKKSVVPGGDSDCTASANRAANPERKIPSRVIEVGNSSVERTDSWRLDYQFAVEVPGMNSGVGEGLAPESCRSLVRLAKVPIVVDRIFP